MLAKYEFIAIPSIILVLAGPAGASYVVQPMAVDGSFTPVTITDDGYVAGTLATKGGSVVLTTNGSDSQSYDFCGTQGEADNTVLTATSPYSVKRYLAGNCGSRGFVYDVVSQTIKNVETKSALGTSVTAVGADGLVAGIFDVHSGGNTVFYDRHNVYTDFFPGEFSYVTKIALGGLIVGYSVNFGGSGSGFTMIPGGTPTIIQPPKTGTGCYLYVFGVNHSGQLATTVVSPTAGLAAAWQSGQFSYAPLPITAVRSGANAINERGDVAGTLEDSAGVSHVFIWRTSTGQVEIIAVPPNATNMTVTSINNHRDVTGTYMQAGASQAYIATHAAGSKTR